MSVRSPNRSCGLPRRTARAVAKINLTLDVLGVRDDGFHELSSLVIGVALADTIRVCEIDEPGVQVECNDAGLAGRDNLVVRAALLLADACGKKPALRIELDKQIPVAAGLGGGSSDAATTLATLNELWGVGLGRGDLERLGAQLGSDVPLFFSLPAAIMGGRGDRVQSVDFAWSGWVVLVYLGIPVATADVYRAWRPADAEGCPSGVSAKAARAACAADIASLSSNHLEAAVFRVCPRVAKAHRALLALDVASVRVSGAGSTLFMLFDDRDEACKTDTIIQNLGLGARTWVLRAPVGERCTVDRER